ncbi:MAG TPA: flavodoxin family protein [Clostridiales bacterium]|jgi:hypothetical protein|nr:flavodoxin family protein [Clostridiales bacterium]
MSGFIYNYYVLAGGKKIFLDQAGEEYMMVIISDDSIGDWGQALEKAFSHAGTQLVRFTADTLNIKPCTACSSCSGKTYGRCVIPDDMQLLLPKIVGCRTLVLVSPVIFGGVSSHIKKVMDRMSALGNPRYQMRGGELVKGMNIPSLNFYLVGVGDDLSEAERSAFLFLNEENRNIMNVKGRTFILDSSLDKVSLDKIAREIAHE